MLWQLLNANTCQSPLAAVTNFGKRMQTPSGWHSQIPQPHPPLAYATGYAHLEVTRSQQMLAVVQPRGSILGKESRKGWLPILFFQYGLIIHNFNSSAFLRLY